MRKIILHLHMTIDNVVSDVDKWIIIDDELLKDSMEYYDTVDSVLFGGRTYPSMADYWQKAESDSESSMERNFAKKT